MPPGVLQSVQFTFRCELAGGLHARPASHLSEEANRFQSQITLTNLRNQNTADLKSVLAIVAADVRCGDECGVAIEGIDGDAAGDSLRRFLANSLPSCDEPPARAAAVASTALPRGLEIPEHTALFGMPVSAGIGQGKVVVLGGLSLADSGAPAAGPAIERQRLSAALDKVRARLQSLIDSSPNSSSAGILTAQLAILGDLALHRELEQAVDSGKSGASAVASAGRHFAGLLGQSESALVRERALDIQELCVELIEEIEGREVRSTAAPLTEPSILVAEALAPHQLLSLDRTLVQGLILESAGATSHAVILARSLGIPAVSGVPGAVAVLASASEAIVDGGRGIVYPRVTPSIRGFYSRERASQSRRRAILATFAAAPAITADGTRMDIGANIASPDEVAAALHNGADGVGLFRTEILFAAAHRLPTEDEQFALYSQAVRAANGKPIILRTLDAGADKPIPALPLPAESNPFLGYRGVRMYVEYREWIGAQIRAALRAAATGPVWIMAPMIANVDEARWFRGEVEAAKAALTARRIPFNASAPIGAMIEVPSAAFLIPELSAVFDFFSIGSNDLSQYFFAASRENPRVSHLANVRHPAFLRLLRQIASDAKTHRRWIGMCGEMAGDPRNLPLLLALGLDEISVSANAIANLKRRTARLSLAACQKLLEQAAACSSAQEVDALLDRSGQTAPRPLLDAHAVTLHGESRDKRSAIAELVDTLFAAGRVDDPQALEDALWAREEVYSTGLGHGFAIPHCKTDAMSANSIGILKLGQPIEWGSLDGAPVRMVILLALRQSGDNGLHMKVFSRLARKLMSEDFRALLLNVDDPGELVTRLGNQLDGEL